MSSDILSWPWHANCDCRLLYDGAVFLPRILEQLQQARRAIDIELYICESGALFDEWMAVLEQRARQIPVRLLIDTIGSEELKASDRQRLFASPIEVRFFNRPQLPATLRSLIRDHRKLILVDQRIGFIGGMGILDECDPRKSGDRAWLDAMVEMHGSVIGDWQKLFEQSWDLAQTPLGSSVRWRLRGGRVRQPLAQHDCGMARANASRGGLHNPLLFHLSHRISRAQRHVWLNTPYFFPPRRLMRALRHAAERGVRVELTTTGPVTDHPSLRYAGQYYYRQLLDAGVHIHEFQPRFAHLKAAIVDDWCTLGSCNYDRWNNHWNLDANVEVIDPDFRQQMLELRHAILSQSSHVQPDSWQQRPLLQRLRQGFWFWFGSRLIGLLRALRGNG